MFRHLGERILSMFNSRKTITSTAQQDTNQKYDDDYADISDINITAIVSNRLSTQATADGTLEVVGKNARADFIGECCNEVFKKIKKITSAALAVGGCAIVPYIENGKILYNIVKQNRIMINDRSGERITNVTILADCMTVNDMVYYRYVNHAVIDNTLYITNKCVNEYGRETMIDAWKDIQDVAISNVNRVLLGFIKSPIDNRRSGDEYGVPVTYGCGKLIDDIKECLAQVRNEFKKKRVRLQVDKRALKKDPKTGKTVIEDDIFMTGHSESGNLFNIFDPAIRESSFHARLERLLALVEKTVGTSPGILTAPVTAGATATEIKAAIGDTFAIVCDIRRAIEAGLCDYAYACDVLANYYSLAPMGEYELKFSWSYSMIESTTETWQQMKDLQSIGGMSKAELRSWQTGEDIEAAQAAVDEIEKKEPSLQSLIGV